jgi:hypothetical protein
MTITFGTFLCSPAKAGVQTGPILETSQSHLRRDWTPAYAGERPYAPNPPKCDCLVAADCFLAVLIEPMLLLIMKHQISVIICGPKISEYYKCVRE